MATTIESLALATKYCGRYPASLTGGFGSAFRPVIPRTWVEREHLPKGHREKIPFAYSEVAALAFTGEDTAAGKSFATWVKKYNEKKAVSEKK